MAPTILLSHDAGRRLLRLARRHAPREFVALLGGDGARVDRVVPLPNAAADDDAFAVDAAAFARAEAGLRDQGRRFVGFAHSHPGGAAAPSRRDREQLWPGCLQLVVGCDRDGGAARIGAFVLDARGGCAPQRLEVEAAGAAAAVEGPP